MAEDLSGVEWREWTDEAFSEARALDKPVLLDIGAVWCHWCHVMDHGIPGDPVHIGTYSHPEVQKRIRENYIPIKVDNDRRPDINARYNMGGWPTTAFLTPDGETLYGETYVPPDRMIALLDYVADLYNNDKDRLAEQTADMRAQRLAAEEQASPPSDLDPETAGSVTLSIKRSFDPMHGGFGKQPKFPHPATLAFTLERYAATGDAQLREIAEKTLQGMDSGGMYDQFAGGFFRYSTTRDWGIPHYEKMLEDNAKLLPVYVLASVVLADTRYIDTANSVLKWLLTDMIDPETGAFAGSQDADAEEHYYGHNLDIRATLPTPYIDRTVYTGWNALAVSALVACYRITHEDHLLAAAKRAFAFLCDNLTMPDVLNFVRNAMSSRTRPYITRHFFADGRPQGSEGLLADQTAFASAALDLFEVTGESEYLAIAGNAAGYISLALEDNETGGFFDLKPQSDAIGELAHPKKDMAENADTSLLFRRLSILSEDELFARAAERALRCFTDEYRQTGYFAAQYARAVIAVTTPALHIVIVGNGDDEILLEMRRAAWKAVAPGKVVETIDPDTIAWDEFETRGYTAGADGAPRAYVCVGTRCLSPAGSVEEMRERIFEAMAPPNPPAR